jgi:hypothetical protein
MATSKISRVIHIYTCPLCADMIIMYSNPDHTCRRCRKYGREMCE